MNSKVRKIMVREGLILIIVLFMVSLFLILSNTYQKGIETFKATHGIQLIHKEGKQWGGVWSWNTWVKSPDVIVEVLDIKGNKRELDKNYNFRATTFDFDTAEIADDTQTEEQKKMWNNQFKADTLKRRTLIHQALKADERATPILGITALIFLLSMVGYAVYLFIRFIQLIRWTVRTYGIKKILKEAKRILKVASSKEILIRVILILGILYLSVSLLKSCGLIEKNKTHNSLRLLR